MVIIQQQYLSNLHSGNTIGTNFHSSNQDDTVEMIIKLFKGARSLGVELSIHKHKNEQSCLKSGIFINNLNEGGLLQSDGRIKVGDRLLAVRQYLPNGDALTFEFDDGHINNDTNEAQQILKRCKGQMEIHILRKLNLEEPTSLPASENLNLINLDKTSVMKTFEFDGNLRISENYNLINETNECGHRDSVTTYKLRKPKRQNASKRYALRFQDQSFENIEYMKENPFAPKSNDTNHSNANISNSHQGVFGRFIICPKDDEFHNAQST